MMSDLMMSDLMMPDFGENESIPDHLNNSHNLIKVAAIVFVNTKCSPPVMHQIFSTLG
jgi:hypothetical protein